MARYRCGALLLLALLGAEPAQAQGEVGPRTSLHCRAISLRVALRTLLRNADVRFEVRGEVPDVPITLDLEQVPLDDALQVVARQARFQEPTLRLSGEDNTFRFTRTRLDHPGGREGAPLLPDAVPSAQLQEAASSSFHASSLLGSLKTVFASAGAALVIDPDVPDIQINEPVMAGTRWELAKQLLIAVRNQAPNLYLGQIGEIYVVARSTPRLRLKRTEAKAGRVSDRHITLVLERVPLRAAIAAVCAVSGDQYSVWPDVPDVPISIELHDVSPQTPFYLLVHRARLEVPGLTASKD